MDMRQMMREERARLRREKAGPTAVPSVPAGAPLLPLAPDLVSQFPPFDALARGAGARRCKGMQGFALPGLSGQPVDSGFVAAAAAAAPPPAPASRAASACCSSATSPSPPSVLYFPNFVSEEEEASLLTEAYRVDDAWVPLRGRRLQRWGGQVGGQVGSRAATATAEGGGASSSAFVAEDLPPWLAALCEAMLETGKVFPASAPPNHVLVNEYQSGQGIMPHKDGPAYEPCVATLSLGAPCVFHYYAPTHDSAPRDTTHPHQSTPRGSSHPQALAGSAVAPPSSLARRPYASLVLQPRSLVVTQGRMYSEFMHGIDPVHEEPVGDTVLNHRAAMVAPGSSLVRGADTRLSLTLRRVANSTPSTSVSLARTDGGGEEPRSADPSLLEHTVWPTTGNPSD